MWGGGEGGCIGGIESGRISTPLAESELQLTPL